MPVYFVGGKLGTGKTLFCVWRAAMALAEGRRVASNVDLDLAVLSPSRAASFVRVPDKPTAWDLQALGHGNPDSYDEDRNGVLILDELGTWLNARSFQDKGRAGLLDFLVHARKLGWDVYLIAQDVVMVDKQVRDALIEFEVRCMRLDKLKVPVFHGVMRTLADVVSVCVSERWRVRLRLKRWGFLPRMHVATARMGEGQNKVVADRWYFRGKRFHAAYDTRQVFTPDWPHGPYSVAWVPPPPPPGFWQRLRELVRPPVPARELRPKLPEVAALASLPPAVAWRRAVELAAGLPRS